MISSIVELQERYILSKLKWWVFMLNVLSLFWRQVVISTFCSRHYCLNNVKFTHWEQNLSPLPHIFYLSALFLRFVKSFFILQLYYSVLYFLMIAVKYIIKWLKFPFALVVLRFRDMPLSFQKYKLPVVNWCSGDLPALSNIALV